MFGPRVVSRMLPGVPGLAVQVLGSRGAGYTVPDIQSTSPYYWEIKEKATELTCKQSIEVGALGLGNRSIRPRRIPSKLETKEAENCKCPDQLLQKKSDLAIDQTERHPRGR